MNVDTSTSRDTLNRVKTGGTNNTATANTAKDAKPAGDSAATPQAQAGDSVQVSKEAQGGQQAAPNPYEGVADGFSTVTVDPWKKGKNDTVEGMLRNQGYSLQDIYNKDKDGKTLIDHVAQANNLRNPNLIRDGAELRIPSRANSESLSSMDLQNGESQKSEVSSEQAGVTTESEMSKDKDGNSTLDVKVNNDNSKDAGLSTETKVGEGGRIDTNSTGTDKGVETNTVAMNKNGSAVTQERIDATADGTDVKIKDIDRTGDNLHGTADANSVQVTNPGTGNSGDVTSKVDISERSTDGFLENMGRDVAEFFGYKGQESGSASFEGAGEININRGKEGETSVSSTTNGKTEELLRTAGDTDDTLLERAGEWGDERIQDVVDVTKAGVKIAGQVATQVGETVSNGIDTAGHYAGKAAGAVGDVAEAGWNKVTGAWNSLFGN